MLIIRSHLINVYKHLASNQLDLMSRHLIFVRKLCQINVEKELSNRNNILLKDSFAKTVKTLKLNDESVVQTTNQLNRTESPVVRMYCCGPTVYDDSHLGHAFTYIRSDLIRRVLDNYYGIYVLMAMNITDIDDKIIAKAKQTNSDCKTVSDFYYNSFIKDMQSLNVLSADCYLRVTDHITNVIDYIKQIYNKGFAYISSTGDINFDFDRFAQTFNISDNFGSESPPITEKSFGKKSPKDFALWKSAKAGEPKWDFVTNDGQTIAGRPGIVLYNTVRSRL